MRFVSFSYFFILMCFSTLVTAQENENLPTFHVTFEGDIAHLSLCEGTCRGLSLMPRPISELKDTVKPDYHQYLNYWKFGFIRLFGAFAGVAAISTDEDLIDFLFENPISAIASGTAGYLAALTITTGLDLGFNKVKNLLDSQFGKLFNTYHHQALGVLKSALLAQEQGVYVSQPLDKRVAHCLELILLHGYKKTLLAK